MFEAITFSILIGSILVAVSILTSVVSLRMGAPLLLLFLAIGLGAGEDGLLGIDFDDGMSAYFIGSLALAIILFDSGFDTSFASYRAAAWPALTLATVGVVLTAGLIALCAQPLLGFTAIESLLLGAILASTDAAAVFFLLRVGGITIRERVRSTLEIESGTNDPMAIFLTISLVELLRAGTPERALDWMVAVNFVREIGLGAVAGFAGGFAIVQAINRIDLERGLYPLLSLSLALVLFAAVSMAHGSGFLAVYVAGVIAGNSKLRSARSLRRFQSGMTWLSQIAMFLTLGLLATPSQFPSLAVPAVTLAVVLVFVARPVAVWLCLLPFGFGRNETTFVAWVGLRGAVSILLGILPVVGGLPSGQIYFNVAFLVVLLSLLVQGWSLRAMAKWLGLVVPPRLGPLDRVELDLPDTSLHELVVYRVTADSPVAQGRRMPRWARPSLILRGGRSLRLHSVGRLQAGDHVYIFATPDQVRLLDRLFAAPSPASLAESAFFGDFVLEPDALVGDVVRLYQATAAPEDFDLTVGALLEREFDGRVEIGDRMPLGLIDLIARDVGPQGTVQSVGLAIEPAGARARLPLFLTRREIMDILRRVRRWFSTISMRAPGTKAGADPVARPKPPVTPDGPT